MWILVTEPAGGRLRKQFPNNSKAITLGSDPQCDVVLRELAPVAAVIFTWEGRLVCRPTTESLPVRVPITPKYDDTEVSYDGFVLEGHRIAWEPDEDRTQPVRMRVTRDGRSTVVTVGPSHRVWQTGITIGSDPACLLALPDLSPRTATIRAAGWHYLLEVHDCSVDSSRIDDREFWLGPYELQLVE